MKRLFSIGLILCLIILLSPSVLAWEWERPSAHITIDERTESSKTDGKASVGLGVHIAGYRENWPTLPSDGDDDIVDLYLIATANTRKIVSYDVFEDSYQWHDLPYEFSLADEQVLLVSLPFKVRFYGGPRSAEYNDIYVSSNGWIKFYDPNATEPNPSNPINNFVAPFWRDLKPNEGSLIKLKRGVVWHNSQTGYNIECFAITWENVPDAYGNPQTFQILLERAPSTRRKHLQSRIWFQYESITLNEPTTVGIKDQQGGKGTFYNYQDLSNGMALLFRQTSNSALIGYLKITLSESEANAWTKIDEDKPSRRGCNVILERDLPDDQARFAFSLAGLIVLLVEGILIVVSPPIWISAAGWMIGATLYTAEQAHDAARQQAEAKLLDHDPEFLHWVKTKGVDDPDGLFISEAVDASLGILVYWVLTDQNNENHNLTITAELTYAEYDQGGQLVAYPTVSTSVDLKLNYDANNSFDTAKIVSSGTYQGFYLGGDDTEDYFMVNVQNGQNILVRMYPPSNADFDLYLYNTSRQQKAQSTTRMNGTIEQIGWGADTSGYWYIKVTKHEEQGFYQLYINIYDPGPPPGGGCPTLLVWNGSQFVKEDVLNIHSELNIDVTVNYTLKTLPALEHGMYILKLAEIAEGYNFSHSFIDYVKLYVIDGEGAWHPCHLTQAQHSTHGNVMRELLFSDDKRTETLKNEETTLRFHTPPIWTNIKAFILQIEGHNPLKY